METGLNNKSKSNGVSSRASALRCFFKQRSISSTLSLPVRIAPAWSRMLRFGNTTKFKVDEFFEVNFLGDFFNLNFFWFGLVWFGRLLVQVQFFRERENEYNIVLRRCVFRISSKRIYNRLNHEYCVLILTDQFTNQM